MSLRSIATIALIISAASVQAQQSKIRVVAVYESSASTAAVVSQMQYLQTAYATAGLPGGVSIELANFGFALELSGGQLGNDDALAQLQEAKSLQRNMWAIRNLYAADLVMLFVDELTTPHPDPSQPPVPICGMGPQDNWIDPLVGGSFVPDGGSN